MHDELIRDLLNVNEKDKGTYGEALRAAAAERIAELEAENRRMREALLNAQTAIDGYHAVTGSLDMGLAEAARQAEMVLNVARAALSQENKP